MQLLKYTSSGDFQEKVNVVHTQLVGSLLLYICRAYRMQRTETINVKLKSPHCMSGPLKTARFTSMMPIP